MIKRSKDFIETAFFLSKYGKSSPPEQLKANTWKEAYHMFYDKLNGGRDISTFEHSLRNARDSFDGHFPETEREGWKDKYDFPSKLNGISLEVFLNLNQCSESEVWEKIESFWDSNTTKFEPIFDDLIAIEESEKEENTSKTEGGIKVYISKRVERNPSLRNDAFKIHGYDCKVCGFNFEKMYGNWGKNWAEVHHLKPIADKKETKTITDPKTDLVVLCANCHRMIHRKKSITLTIAELKNKIQHNSYSQLKANNQ